MRWLISRSSLSFIGVFVFLSIICSCERKPVEKKEISPVEVTTYLVRPQTIPVDFSFVGVVQSSHEVQIRSRVEGYLNKIAYEEGSFVKAGDLLFEIDPRRFIAQKQEAQANLEAEQAALWSAEQTLNRLKILYEETAASKKDLDDATAQMLVARAAVSLSQARLVEAQLDLDDASIRSPISGVTSSANFQEGTLISPNANGTLTTVSVLDPIWVILNVSESYFLTSLEEIAQGQLTVPENFNFDVIVKMSNGAEFPYIGKVNFVSPLFNQSTGTLATRAVFQNPEKQLKPGEFVNAIVTGAKRLNAIMIPQAAVQQGVAGQFVYVVNEEKKAEFRPIKVKHWYKEFWVIESGLQENDIVIVGGVNKMQDGTPVKIKKK